MGLVVVCPFGVGVVDGRELSLRQNLQEHDKLSSSSSHELLHITANSLKCTRSAYAPPRYIIPPCSQTYQDQKTISTPRSHKFSTYPSEGGKKPLIVTY